MECAAILKGLKYPIYHTYLEILSSVGYGQSLYISQVQRDPKAWTLGAILQAVSGEAASREERGRRAGFDSFPHPRDKLPGRLTEKGPWAVYKFRY